MKSINDFEWLTKGKVIGVATSRKNSENGFDLLSVELMEVDVVAEGVYLYLKPLTDDDLSLSVNLSQADEDGTFWQYIFDRSKGSSEFGGDSMTLWAFEGNQPATVPAQPVEGERPIGQTYAWRQPAADAESVFYKVETPEESLYVLDSLRFVDLALNEGERAPITYGFTMVSRKGDTSFTVGFEDNPALLPRASQEA